MLGIAARREQRRPALFALAGGLGLTLLATGGALASGGDLQAMVDICQRMLAAAGVELSGEQIRSMMGACMGGSR